ncbi:MAG: GTPase Era [Bacteroidetes bacterium]|nr:GTPase Era [Bacteroidota bacterium]MBU1720157.1 GTPase Era [Bacteroidota bacterium]
MDHKAGFVNIIGNPNVGKSTLMNALVGERLSIITSKAQTTRHRIMGIVNADDFQIVYSDTPGILKPAYKLQESMLSFVKVALQDADIFLYITEKDDKEPDEEIISKLSKSSIPVILIINKCDLLKKAEIEKLKEIWTQRIAPQKMLVVSALHKTNVDQLIAAIAEFLPVHPPFFPKDELTDKPMRFFASEIIREKILLNYQQEIPYSTEVVIESYKEEETIVKISAVIYVSRRSQKGIVIGHKGGSLKKVGTEARLDIEAFLGSKVFLELFVKVQKDWRENEIMLKNFGYLQK